MLQMSSGGIDLFYIDESGWNGLFSVTAVRIPFIRNLEGNPFFVWGDYLERVRAWKANLSKKYQVRSSLELHGNKILKCQGLYHKSGRNLTPTEAINFYHEALESLTLLEIDEMLFTVTSQNISHLAKQVGIYAGLMGLFQRMRTYCVQNERNGMVYFDDGHEEEYTKVFRQACKYLPTGVNGTNLPLDMFVGDANFKKSNLSVFVQVADLVTYAANIKLRYEAHSLDAKRVRRSHHKLYDVIPENVRNLHVTTRRPDGIAPII